MKTRIISTHITAGAVAAFLACSLGQTRATTATRLENSVDASIQGNSFQNIRWEEEKIEKLRHAYFLLDHADTSYHGHKDEAMHSIKKAAEILGVELNGHGHEEESHWASERKMREAKRLLEDLQDETKGREQEHVHHAVKELDKALEVR